MRLSKIAILAIKGTDVEFKILLAKALDISEQTFYRYLRENNDMLTKAACLQLIRQETGLSDDQILENEEAEKVRSETLK